MKTIFSAIGLTAILALTSNAQSPTPKDAPDLSFEITEEDSEEFHKYFYFHQDGISYADAKAGIAECNEYRIGPVGMEGQFVTIVPMFVSLSERQVNVPYVQNDAGLVGAVIGDLISASLVLKNKGQRMRKCMEYKGYDRYGLSKDLWKNITHIDAADYIDLHARIASGPKPMAEKLLP